MLFSTLLVSLHCHLNIYHIYVCLCVDDFESFVVLRANVFVHVIMIIWSLLVANKSKFCIRMWLCNVHVEMYVGHIQNQHEYWSRTFKTEMAWIDFVGQYWIWWECQLERKITAFRSKQQRFSLLSLNVGHVSIVLTVIDRNVLTQSHSLNTIHELSNNECSKEKKIAYIKHNFFFFVRSFGDSFFRFAHFSCCF